MNKSLAISVFIFVVAAGLGWNLDRRLAAARSEAEKLAAESKHLGIPLDDVHSTRSKMRDRLDRDGEARQLAVEFIELAKQMENGFKRDEASPIRYRDFYLRVSALDASRLKGLAANLLSNQELDEKNRTEQVVNLLWLVLAKKDPRATLAFVTEHSATLKSAERIGDVISESLGNWAKDDPLAAAEWMKTHGGGFPAAMLHQSRARVFHWAAAKDPVLAFSLITGLELNASEAHGAMNTIVTVAKTDDERTATLAALRVYREANRSDKKLLRAVDDNLGYFADGFRTSSFETGSKWISDAKLSPSELDQICDRLSGGIVEDTGKWIEWMGNTLPPGKSDWPIIDMMDTWTRQDYEAAGKWLVSSPEGPSRNAAIRGYAQTVFKHDPETAMQWIMSLPPGEERQQTLIFILRNRLRHDQEAAAAFAKEHGIK